jgi:hypothetical protein
MEKTLLSPCCKNKKAILHTEKRKHIVENNSYEGEFFVYKCEGCGLGWTTTESDTKSLATFKQKKL